MGESGFSAPLVPGDRLVIENVGAYTLVKARMFNGVNLPSLHCQPTDGVCELVSSYSYDDFKTRCGM